MTKNIKPFVWLDILHVYLHIYNKWELEPCHESDNFNEESTGL